MLGNAEGKLQIPHLCFCWGAPGHHFQVHVINTEGVAGLHEKSADDGFQRDCRRPRIGNFRKQQEAQVFLGGDDGARLVTCAGCQNHLGKNLGNFKGRLLIKRAVESQYAAEGADGVTQQRFAIGFHK